MGIVWEAYHKGVPLLGVPGNSLDRSCSDTDPYVRKTATMCVAKLYDINPELVEDQVGLFSSVDLHRSKTSCEKDISLLDVFCRFQSYRKIERNQTHFFCILVTLPYFFNLTYHMCQVRGKAESASLESNICIL